VFQSYTWVVLSVIAASIIVGVITGWKRVAWQPWRMIFPGAVFAVMIGQLGLGIFRVIAVETGAGALVLFWIYAVVTIFISFGAGLWAYVDRTEISSFILVISGLTLVVMISRMHGIWGDQVGHFQ